MKAARRIRGRLGRLLAAWARWVAELSLRLEEPGPAAEAGPGSGGGGSAPPAADRVGFSLGNAPGATGGPPEHWLRVVRQHAPQLLRHAPPALGTSDATVVGPPAPAAPYRLETADGSERTVGAPAEGSRPADSAPATTRRGPDASPGPRGPSARPAPPTSPGIPHRAERGTRPAPVAAPSPSPSAASPPGGATVGPSGSKAPPGLREGVSPGPRSPQTSTPAPGPSQAVDPRAPGTPASRTEPPQPPLASAGGGTPPPPARDRPPPPSARPSPSPRTPTAAALRPAARTSETGRPAHSSRADGPPSLARGPGARVPPEAGPETPPGTEVRAPAAGAPAQRPGAPRGAPPQPPTRPASTPPALPSPITEAGRHARVPEGQPVLPGQRSRSAPLTASASRATSTERTRVRPDGVHGGSDERARPTTINAIWRPGRGRSPGHPVTPEAGPGEPASAAPPTPRPHGPPVASRGPRAQVDGATPARSRARPQAMAAFEAAPVPMPSFVEGHAPGGGVETSFAAPGRWPTLPRERASDPDTAGPGRWPSLPAASDPTASVGRQDPWGGRRARLDAEQRGEPWSA